jgi:hypothetical protein
VKENETNLLEMFMPIGSIFILTAVAICVTVYATKSFSMIAYFGVLQLSQRVYNAIFSYFLYLKIL